MSRVQKLREKSSRAAAAPHQYTGCGLDNVYLANGFTLHQTPYGDGVAIAGLDELHEAIAARIVTKRSRISPKELRFLRKLLGLTQETFAQFLATDEQNIGRYERGEHPIPGTVDRLARTVYWVRKAPKAAAKELAGLLSEKLEDIPAGQSGIVFERRSGHWQSRTEHRPQMAG